MTPPRILLSPPDVGEQERAALLAAFDSNWIAPIGPCVDQFELDFSQMHSDLSCVALSSGTAAIHLALLLHGVGPGDDVVVPTLTFAATANPVIYCGANPLFVDSETRTWNLDPERVHALLNERAATGKLPKAVIAVDLYGQCADYDRLSEVCSEFEVVLISDAAESLGASYKGQPSGTLTPISCFSFNGNKIITTSSGGMLVASKEQAERARYLATQARLPAPYYEHSEVGYNYRMSNLLAAIGSAQLASLPTKVAARTATFEHYKSSFADLPLDPMPISDAGEPNYWLSVFLVKEESRLSSGDICARLDELGIEARRAWKPMHLQPVFADAHYSGGTVSENVFERGICLPSGSSMTSEERNRVTQAIKQLLV